jgi:hypothetical protein
MIASPSAKFSSPRVHVSLRAKPYERRSVCVLAMSQAKRLNPKDTVVRCCGGTHTHFTRAKVVEAVAREEMMWLDRFHNTACFTPLSTGTWQKTRSGPVCTMQLVEGARGRYVPARQRKPEFVLP